jgi:hypothetical protein
MLHRKLDLTAALFLAVATWACGSKSDAGASGDVSAYVGGKQTSAAEAAGDDAGGSEPNKAVAAIDPCALLKNEEIVDQLEKAQEPNNLAAWKAKGGTWKITPTPQQQGIAKQCHYAFIGDAPDGNFIHKSDFTLIVTDGAFVNPDLNNAKNRPIPGLGDEAYVMSRGPMMPYARVGKVAIGLEGFPSTPTAKAGADLLRLAVGRVQK